MEKKDTFSLEHLVNDISERLLPYVKHQKVTRESLQDDIRVTSVTLEMRLNEQQKDYDETHTAMLYVRESIEHKCVQVHIMMPPKQQSQQQQQQQQYGGQQGTRELNFGYTITNKTLKELEAQNPHWEEHFAVRWARYAFFVMSANPFAGISFILPTAVRPLSTPQQEQQYPLTGDRVTSLFQHTV